MQSPSRYAIHAPSAIDVSLAAFSAPIIRRCPKLLVNAFQVDRKNKTPFLFSSPNKTGYPIA
jgi:hypothetical protein